MSNEIIELSKMASSNLDALLGTATRDETERKKLVEDIIDGLADDLWQLSLLDENDDHPCHHQRLKLIGGNEYECSVCGKIFEMEIKY